MDFTLRIGGEAGQGIQTIGAALARVFTRSGYYVFSHQDYMSRIRGGHNFYQLRLSDGPISSSRDKPDLVIALDRQTAELDCRGLAEGGMIIYDSETIRQKYDGPQFLDTPFRKIALEISHKPVMENTVACGAVLGMLGMGLGRFEALIAEMFAGKGQEVIDQNIACAKAGYEHARANCPSCLRRVSEPFAQQRLMLIDGVTATALGALMSGVKFYAAYPMTPSTGVFTYLASKAKDYGLVVEQAEDEIAAINMAIGASFAGVRAMTGTSGGGFALMVEGLSLAGMTETPVVIFLGMRPGPATGFPTRTEQADLLFALHAGHGEFPRVIFAPGTPEEAYYLTNKAFDLAEKYQVPAFILMDQYLADSQWSFLGLDSSRLVCRDYRLRQDALKKLPVYKRHAFTDSGITPLAVPGASSHLVVTDSDEHDEEGHIVEDAETRVRMVEKRFLKKLPLIRDDMNPPSLFGSEKPDVVICGWGSTYGIMKEAVDALKERHNIAMLHFSEIYPFPSNEKFDYLDILRSAQYTICVENNASGQFALLMRMETGYVFTDRLNRFDGRPFTLDSFIGEIDGRIKGF